MVSTLRCPLVQTLNFDNTREAETWIGGVNRSCESDFNLNTAFSDRFALSGIYSDYGGAGSFNDKSVTCTAGDYRVDPSN